MADKTVLYDRHVALGGRMVDFGGYLLPVQFAGVLAEHRHCRSAAAVFDTSHMGQFLFRGGAAAGALGYVCTQDAAAMPVGRCRYGFLLDEAGGVIDDTILMRLADEEFLLVVNAGPRGGDWEWITSHLPDGVVCENLSAGGWAKIDLQGPRARRVLAGHTETDLSAVRYFTALRTKVGGAECILSRTGYTGELGYEIMAPGEAVAALFDAFLADDTVAPAGLGARDSLRLEMCYPLYGHELSRSVTPVEAGLEGFFNLERDFLGVERLREQAAGDVRRRLVAFQGDTRRRTNPHDRVALGGRMVGEVTSGAFSPSLECSIGMAYVESELAGPGTELTVETPRAKVPVAVRDKPLYKDGTCRAKVEG